jgi:hypothetical protein
MKWLKFSINAQCLRVITVVVVQVGAVKIYVAAVSGGAPENGKRG